MLAEEHDLAPGEYVRHAALNRRAQVTAFVPLCHKALEIGIVS